MDGKILLFIRDYQLKRKMINCMMDLEVPFVECFEQDELNFKVKLFNVENRLYIYEFVAANDEEQFEQLKSMKSKGWKVLVIFPEYSIKYIDKCQEIKIDDLMVYPIEDMPLKNKIKTILKIPMMENDQVNAQEDQADQEDQKDDTIKEVIQLEVNRAERGQYALSFVMIDFASISVKIQKSYLPELKKILRETDLILSSDKDDIYILVCPFTPKNFLVEVENKIRYLFEEEQKQQHISMTTKIYVYGLTLGEDGHSFEEIYEKLIKRIGESKLLDQRITASKTYSPERLKAYRKMFEKFH